MRLRARLVAILALAGIAFAVPAQGSAAGSSGLPARPVPAGLHAVAGKAGGRIVEGSLRGSSADAAFRAGLARLRGYFDRPPRVLGAVRSKDQALTLALFKATLAGTPVGGYILTTYVAHGPSHLDVLFDRVDRASRSVNPMLAQISALQRSATPAADSGNAIESLHDVTSPDGTVHARLPSDWHATIFAQGQMAAVGPDKAEVDQEISVRLMDPNGSLERSQEQLQAQMGGRRLVGDSSLVLPYTSDVERAYRSVYAALAQRGILPTAQIQFEHVRPFPRNADGSTSAELTGTSTARGTTKRFDGQILVSPPNTYGAWMISIKMLSAPQDRYERDLPTLLAIFSSYNVDQGARNQQVASSMQANREGMARGQAYSASVRANMAATFNASMDHARSVQSGIDRSTSGFVHYLNDTTVVESAGGGRSSVDAGFAQNVVDNDPQNFRIVPVSEYRSGD